MFATSSNFCESSAAGLSASITRCTVCGRLIFSAGDAVTDSISGLGGGKATAEEILERVVMAESRNGLFTNRPLSTAASRPFILVKGLGVSLCRGIYAAFSATLMASDTGHSIPCRPVTFSGIFISTSCSGRAAA